MKTFIFTCFLFAGIAGAQAQTNNNTNTPTPNQNPSSTVAPDNTGTSVNPDNRGTANDGVIKNDPQNTDTTSSKNPVTNPQYKTDPRNEYEKPHGTNPAGKTTTPAPKKSPKQGTTPKPGN